MLTAAIQNTKPPRRLGPIAELRIASRSAFALTVGAFVGGSAPMLSYYTVHLGHLLDRPQIDWRSPLWLLVAGSLALSSKSVFRWGRNTFGEWYSGVALVLMLELAMLLAPHPLINQVALGFLVAINATVYGCALAIRDQDDTAHLKAVAAAAVAAASASVGATEAPELPIASAKPKTTAATTATATAEPEYGRALAHLMEKDKTSTEDLRTALRVRQPKAAKLVSQLESEGIVGKPDPLDRGRRPVLITATKNFG